MFTTPTTTLTITTTKPLPAGLDVDAAKETALALLHDHPALISLNPLLARYERIPPSHGAPNAYIITDRLPYLPFGLWTGELHIYAEFVDKADGVLTKVRAPGGFVSEGVYSVREEEGKWMVEESVEARCPLGLGWYVEGTTKKSHEVILGKFVEEVRTRIEKKKGEGSAVVDGQ
ncbi:hypothetical protein GTA08_BOTSDO09983 [Botryosphaeria dothidea]|uniref:DUF7053 domain-containing protein n=1 Tax=Botryosphaeria dothidea TaxID=55169 RepID=A0A8H4IMW0_9PEZI|nr:hypothetical protein GTA08_BOTSDO09983 [Botryosphaeria dothidea]